MKKMKSIKKLTAFLTAFVMACSLLIGTAFSVSAEPMPSVSIIPQATYSYNQQSFLVTVDRNSTYRAYEYGSSSYFTEGSIPSGTSELTFNTSALVELRVYTPYTPDVGGTQNALTIGYSAQAYYLNVTGVGDDGVVLFQDQLLMDANNYPEYAYNAEPTIQVDGTVYTAEQTQYLIEYGSGDVTIHYTSGSSENHSFTISYLDEQDNTLYSETKTLAYGESCQVTAPATFEYNGQTYQLTSRISSYDVTYDNAASAYVFEYAPVIPTPEEPYEITINLVDADNNNAVLYSIRQTVDVDSSVRVELPSTYEVNFKQYQLEEGVANYIEREFSSTDPVVYNIPYRVAAESVPYEISINFVDYNNPDIVLTTVRGTITPDGTPFIYDLSSNSTLEVNGTVYQLMAGQGNENGQIVHTYGTATRTYNVYYTSEEVANPQPYAVTLRYISVSDNAVLGTQQQEVAYGSSVEFEAAPETLDVDGVEYTRLNGQEEDIVHDYNVNRTDYAVYYIESDALEAEELEPEVITQVVTQYVTEEGTVVENADGTAVPEAVPVTVVNDGQGGETAYNEAGQEVEINDGNIEVVNPDTEAIPMKKPHWRIRI